MHNLADSKDQTKPRKSTQSKKIIIGGFFYFFFQYMDAPNDNENENAKGLIKKTKMQPRMKRKLNALTKILLKKMKT